MPSNRIKAMIDALATGKVADANKAFSDEMSELVNTKLADKKIEVASRMTMKPDEVEHPEQPSMEDMLQDETRETGEVDAEEYDEEE